jgi:quercetin dioxygenase-like cupin family protein
MVREIIHTRGLSWQELRAFPGTAQVKLLRDEPSGGAPTMLVRVPPGGQILPHSHMASVQHYVLEGDYETEGETCSAGTYRFLPKDANVEPITTKAGVTILMIYDPNG